MDTPGNILKAEREKQGKSLKEISINIKINIDYLSAIEEDNYSELPAEVFTKAYLRLYAEELGLDGDDLLGMYYEFGKEELIDKKALPEIKAEPSTPAIIRHALNAAGASAMKAKSFMKTVAAFLRKLKPSFSFDPASLHKLKPSIKPDVSFIKRGVSLMTSRKSLLGAAAVIAVAFVVILIINTDKPVPDVPVAAEKKTGSVKRLEGDKKELTPVEKTNIPSDKKKEVVEEKKMSEKLVLKIIAEELTWASVSIDGGEFSESLLHAGETVTLRAEDNFNIKIGNAGGTKLVLNGRELEKLGPHGKVVHINLP